MGTMIEQDCTFSFKGGQYTAGGAAIFGDRATAYMSADLKTVTDWHGRMLGTAKVVSSWRMPHSWVSPRQYQVEAIIDGITYTGRTMGGNLLWRGKRKA